MAKFKLKTKIKEAGSSIRLSGKYIQKMQRVSESESEGETIVRHYQAYKYAKRLMLIVVLLLAIVVFGIDIGLGPYTLDFITVYQQIFDRLMDWGQEMSTDMRVVWNLRMPRVIAALLAGMGLAMAGAAMQSMMKNPLADPYTTGISSGAALGATMAMTLGICLIPGNYGIVINAFIFALIPAAFIMLISTFRKPSPATIILSGIALMYIFNAIQSYMMLIADPNAASSVYAWTVGSLNSIRWEQIPFLLAVSLFGGIALMYMARILNTMNSGDAYSKSIGININRARMIVLLVVSLVSAGIVSFTGIIGFIGLVSPHIARMFVGSDNKILIPAAGLMGACIMMLADCVVQLVMPSLPIGIITSILGGPIFMLLILRQKKEIW